MVSVGTGNTRGKNRVVCVIGILLVVTPKYSVKNGKGGEKLKGGEEGEGGREDEGKGRKSGCERKKEGVKDGRDGRKR